jgi:hypothetical protein
LEKFELIRLEKANYSIKRMSRLLQVSRSGYYKWAKAQATRLRGEDERQKFLDQLDKRIHDIWEDSDEVYGAPRITAELAEVGVYVNRKTVAKRMRMMGIEGISPRAFVPVTTIQSKRKSTLPDLVKRLFDQGQLNRVWMSDITYLRTGEGWLYLCVIRDGHSRRVLGWAMSSVQDSHLVEVHCAWHIPCAVMYLMGWSSMRIAVLSLRANSCGRCVENWALPSLSAVLACALITRWPSHFGRR